MNCKRCHHMDEAHTPSKDSDSLVKLGTCGIPNCPCKQYLDPIQSIDEELL